MLQRRREILRHLHTKLANFKQQEARNLSFAFLCLNELIKYCQHHEALRFLLDCFL